MLINGYQSFQYLPSQISEQTYSGTVGEAQVSVVTTSPEANRLAKRIEYSAGKSLLHYLNISTTQPLKDLLQWLASFLGRSAAAPGAAEDLHPQHAEPTGTAAPFRRSFGNGFKAALDAVSLLATASKVDHKRFDVTLKAEQINSLQGAIVEGRANFKEIEMMVETRGDLQCVRTLALSLTHVADSHQPSVKAALANLASQRPNTSIFLGGLLAFIHEQESRWFEKASNSKVVMDAEAQSCFIIEGFQEHINKLGADEAHKILEQLEGHFGQRAHEVVGAAIMLVGEADDDNELLCRLVRAEVVADKLISLLRAKLDMPDINMQFKVTGDLSITDRSTNLNQFNPLELAALVSLGIKLQ
ncbi:MULTISPECIES: hypothetical protein [unclassified Pseudomonas]|uniref:hypothetical protein n=1 Tax=unclassified Pseudomonas TaxID=196821 RepID=UPI0018E6B827|nr:hypothetical protein [Pseudomonas sp. CCOS 191]MBI6951370.1 hypothetical protein [Pseudomonas sp. CCOS 191]